jgi:hypothetical protein
MQYYYVNIDKYIATCFFKRMLELGGIGIRTESLSDTSRHTRL